MTGKMDASEAARIMADPNATPEERSVAASALSDVERGHHTSKRVGSEAGQLLDDSNISEEDRSVAGSDLSQDRRRGHKGDS
ncbi:MULTISPECIES: hypothetical protein [Streptomyces]|uniref:hypothetical protein n=1 Tax=Streptomyces TaxID=1883 RepID=UPI00136A7E54|nr:MULTISPECIES: hypothetical protein [Streptomyces]MBV1948917.1 hypothetical protein [Streptomyces sp. BV129]MYS14402.1 hypothetical protein [Streptomyces sp. SID4982]BDH05424.1 hypothetical protein HEK131_26510 [Streptomyces seoulensis]